jgi:hypothetical protein
MKTYFHEKLEKLKRRYFEVFGDLEAQAEFLKLSNLVLLGVLIAVLLGAFLLAHRPPVVIRVTEVGVAEPIRDFRINNAPSEPEILYFSKSFTRRYTEYNSYTLSRDVTEAFNQMTGRFQKLTNRDLVESGLLTRVREAGLHAAIEFKEEKIERETPEFIRVSLIGVRTIQSYKNPDYKESALFKAELTLKKCPRSMAVPFGLLVEDYHEMILNKLEERK